jgi:hypothetical protein
MVTTPQMATNYPLVRIQNDASKDIVYCCTHNHSSMGVATGSIVHSTEFLIPSGIGLGASALQVVREWDCFGFCGCEDRMSSLQNGRGVGFAQLGKKRGSASTPEVVCSTPQSFLVQERDV